MSQRHLHVAGCEIFQFANYRWCIDHASELIKADPDAARLVDDIPIAPLRRFLPLESTPPGHIKVAEVAVKPDYAATVDLSKPIMFAPVVTRSGENLGGIAIDGWHRIYRAASEGIRELPGYVLSEPTSMAAQFPWR